MRKPKLLLVADTYYPKVDGTLRFMEEFIRRAEHQFDLALLVPDFGVRKGKNVIYLESSKRLVLSGYPSMKLSWKNIRRIKQEVQKADMIFIQGPALISYLSIWYARRLGKKSFFYMHVIPWELFAKFAPSSLQSITQFLVKKITLFFLNRCHEIIVPYHALGEELKKTGLKTPLVVARLGVDIDLFSPAKDKRFYKRKSGLDEERIVIGYVGRISKEKNINVLLDAFRKLKHPSRIFLLLVGDGTPEIVEECQTINHGLITQFVEKEKVAEYLKAMDIFVMPSLTETTSLATLEAMASGLPVIVTRVGYMQKYIVKEYNGLFFPRNSSSVLAAKLEKLIARQNMRESLGQNARKTIAYSFSWERSINRIKRLLMEH